MNCLSKSQKKMTALVKFSSSYVCQYEGFIGHVAKWAWSIQTSAPVGAGQQTAREWDKNEASAKALFNFNENGWLKGFLVT